MVGRMKPDGSFLPGVINFAITPATNPIMIVQMMLTGSPPAKTYFQVALSKLVQCKLKTARAHG
jgi:hypothetical protein